ncbi:MAG: DUF362 domain-containing protein [Oscillospiraceae bacterium]|nr:DUF362 domain-containing protein [Oscillospiraceae bacterium]
MDRQRKIYVEYGGDIERMTLDLLEAYGVADRIPAGASVALKPNLVVAKPAQSGATTHPEILRGVLRYLRAHGVRDVSIIEGSWVGDDTKRAFDRAGYRPVAAEFGVPLFDLKDDETKTVKTAIGEMRICARALDAGFLINLPVLKGHCQTGMTCALKNCKGCLPDSEKRRFHSMGLHRPIGALAAYLKPAVTLVDSICGDPGFEEGGNPVQTDRLFLGDDPVQLDAYGCRLLGMRPEDVPYIGYAERFGAGRAAWTEDDIVALTPAPQKKAVRTDSRALLKNVREDSACSACCAALTAALVELDGQGTPYTGPLAIGQGNRGLDPGCPGIGNCCRAASAFAKGCPPTQQAIAAFLRELRQKTDPPSV